MPAYRATGQSITFQVRLTPKGGRDALEGWAQSADGTVHLKARVRAVAENGKANTALMELLAERLAVPKSAVRIVAGTASRLKRVEISGDCRALAARIEGLGK